MVRKVLLRARIATVIPCLLGFAAPSKPAGAATMRTAAPAPEDCEAARPAGRRPGSNNIVVGQAPLRLVALRFYDRIERKPLASTPTGNDHQWPGKYDLIPTAVKTQWEPVGEFTSAEVTRLIANDCYRTTVELNGVPIGRFDNEVSSPNHISIESPGSGWFKPCPEAKKCLYLTVSQAAWAAAKPPWILDIRITRLTKHKMLPTDVPTIDEQGNAVPVGQYDYRPLVRSRARILPNPQSAGSYFTEKVYPTFQHARCQNCHALGSVDALISRHADLKPMFDSYVRSVRKVESPTGPVITCNSGCHNVYDVVQGEQFEETEWKAPAFERNIDWRQMNAVLTCSRVKANLPTRGQAEHHFHEDARIAWAVNNARTPFGNMLGRAPPGSFTAWKSVLDPWLWGTMPCP